MATPWIVASLTFAGAFAPSPPVQAAEDGAAFLAALRERNMHEVAQGYLESRENSPLVDEAFRQRIPYEQGMTLIDRARRTSDTDQRSKLLQQAQERLSQFAAAKPDDAMAGEARLQLAQVLVERGRQDIALAERKAAGEADRQELLESARATMDRARTVFAEVQEHYEARLKEFPKNLDPRTEADKIEQRDEFRLQWLTAWFYKARTKYEKARAYAKGSAEFTQLNQEAANELGELHEKYGTRLVGLTAHLYEGRAYQAIGELDKAIGCFETLVSQPDGPPEFRLLITQAFAGLGECLLQQEKFDEVIQRCETWLQNSTSLERERPDWLAVRFVVAQAKIGKASTLEEGSPAWNRLRREAREEFKLIARQPSPLRRDAQQEFASLTKRSEDERAASEVDDFSEAFQLARDAFDEMQVLQAQAADETDPDKSANLKDNASSSRQRAKAYFARALALASGGDELDIDDLHLARYYLGWLHFQDEEYHRAAILGDFLARRYPDSLPARDAAKLALYSHQQLYRTAKEHGATGQALESEVERMASIADFIVRRWPGTEDAALAQDMLVGFAVREGRIEDATAMLENVDPQRRLQSELRVANGLWAEYLEARRAEDADGQNTTQTTRLRDEAVERLEVGFRKATDAGDVSSLAATTALYLAQAHLLADDYAEAIEVLEAEPLGPWTLAREKHPAASQPEFLVEALKAAVQAYALVSPPQQDKAADAMEALEQALRSGGAATQVAEVYLGLGLQLKQRLEVLQSAGREQQAGEVAAAFSNLLDALAETDAAGNDWNTQLWIAHTLYEVGQTIQSTNRSSLAEAYLKKSLTAYNRLLKTAEKQADFAPSERSLLAIRKRKADVLRTMGRFRAAIDIYSAILADNMMMLDVQRDAAYAYQSWGKEDARRLENAIYGGRRVKSTGENRIWGWLKLSKVAAQAARRDADYRDWYFEARLNAARSRYLAALATQDEDSRKSQLQKAKNAVRALHQLYPDLGGVDRQQEFHELLLQIQHALGEPPEGLQAFTR